VPEIITDHAPVLHVRVVSAVLRDADPMRLTYGKLLFIPESLSVELRTIPGRSAWNVYRITVTGRARRKNGTMAEEARTNSWHVNPDSTTPVPITEYCNPDLPLWAAEFATTAAAHLNGTDYGDRDAATRAVAHADRCPYSEDFPRAAHRAAAAHLDAL
jgi:hypothetical protein